MNPAIRRGAVLVCALFLATLVQAVWAGRISLMGGRPDFVTATLLCCALFFDAGAGAAAGFLAGLLLASISSPPAGGFGSIIVSRTLVGFGVGWLDGRIFRNNVSLAVAFTAAGTLAAESIFYVFSPQRPILVWARHTLVAGALNAVIAPALFLILRRTLGAKAAAEPRTRTQP